jgi:phosphomannomutase
MLHRNDAADDDDSGRTEMKGMIFTEFLELVERTHSAELAETLVANADLPSGGIYTSVGNYDHREMVTLVVALSRQTKQPVDEVLHWFGKNLFVTLSTAYPGFFAGKDNAFSVLVGIESVIHTEVRKLYPDAEISTVDGVKFDFPEGWVHLRKSNTEPIVRVIAEHTDKAKAAELAEQVIRSVKEIAGIAAV